MACSNLAILRGTLISGVRSGASPDGAVFAVEKHDGTITFETEVGKGTTFIMRLPIGGEST